MLIICGEKESIYGYCTYLGGVYVIGRLVKQNIFPNLV